jgi:GT2 family glycosyltransferase
MTQPTASVIIVSRHRAEALMRCVVALTQQDHPCFEVIVVADPVAVVQVKTMGLALKLVTFDQANISAARNAGLALVAAPVVAFIDDDAVAEPTWLARLTAPFVDSQVIAATGFVRGRNGISFQWQACEVDALAQDHPFDAPELVVRPGTPQRAVKTQGTNCAFHTNTLRAAGGFDPAYRFYLDEADVNLRMAHLGQTAVVPEAQVHHGFAASDRRRADRVPLSLYDIAASTAVFLRRHAPHADLTAALHSMSTREAARAKHHRVAGRIGSGEEAGLLQSLALGWADGLALPLTALPPLPVPQADLLPLPGTGPRPGRVIAGRFWQRNRLAAQAMDAAKAGAVVTLICLAPTLRAHRVAFQTQGYWQQTGGLFGPSDRTGPRLRLIGFRRRIAEEVARISGLRPTC